MSTVFGIVKQSDGYIDCSSEKGKGTTFTVYFPATSEIALRRRDSMSTMGTPGGTEKILLVDDNEAVRTVARITLEGAGYVVIEAPDGEVAIAKAAKSGADIALLVTDVVMPRLSGKEVARRLEKLSPKVRTLYISGYTADVISHHGILDPGVDLLQKPFSSVEFLAKVREILDRPEFPAVPH